MQLLQKKILVPMAAVAVIAAGGYGVSQVSAASSPTGTHQTLAQVIANDFHLDQSKVQSVISQYRAGNQTAAEARYEQSLAKAVTNGKITQAQETAILAEHKTLQAELTAATGSNRRTVMQQVRSDAQTWATQNNVSASYLLAPRQVRGGGRGRHMTSSPSPSPSASPSS